MEASAPTHPSIEPEPPEWQPRALSVGVRLLAGAEAFFFISFVFAYFYLRSLHLNTSWKIGPHVNPPIGFGVAIMVVLVASGVLMWLAGRRWEIALHLSAGALALALAAIALQCIEYTTLGFGPGNGAYASVFIGWTITYALFALFCAYWIETQVASLWRLRREGVQRAREEGVPAHDIELAKAGIAACAWFWVYYVALGFIAFVILYLI
jgi:heme/copper-type cytochrome/quinol oxidase subunit 3